MTIVGGIGTSSCLTLVVYSWNVAPVSKVVGIVVSGILTGIFVWISVVTGGISVVTVGISNSFATGVISVVIGGISVVTGGISVVTVGISNSFATGGISVEIGVKSTVSGIIVSGIVTVGVVVSTIGGIISVVVVVIGKSKVVGALIISPLISVWVAFVTNFLSVDKPVVKGVLIISLVVYVGVSKFVEVWNSLKSASVL